MEIPMGYGLLWRMIMDYMEIFVDYMDIDMEDCDRYGYRGLNEDEFIDEFVDYDGLYGV